jgi:hypothetical protein
MRRTALATCAAGVLLAAVALLAPAGALGRSDRSASNSATFADSTGENANAPDITSIAVSNDDKGAITFQVNIANRPALTDDMAILMFLNTDNNPATGDPTSFGADYLVQLTNGAVDLFPWAGTDYGAGAAAPSLTYSYAATGATIHVNAADIGATKQFTFAAVAISGIAVDANGNADFTNAAGDSAPDAGHGAFSYQVKTTLKLSVVSFTSSPKPAKSGGPFSVGLAVNENDTSGPVASGTVTCSATIAGKHIPATHRGSVLNGIATCVWHLPKSVKGKTIRGTVTLTVKGTSVQRAFSAKIT